jgi:hypothetical protein
LTVNPIFQSGRLVTLRAVAPRRAFVPRKDPPARLLAKLLETQRKGLNDDLSVLETKKFLKIPEF